MGSDQQHPLALTAPSVHIEDATSVSVMGLVSPHAQLHQLGRWEKSLPWLFPTALAFLKQLPQRGSRLIKKVARAKSGQAQAVCTQPGIPTWEG